MTYSFLCRVTALLDRVGRDVQLNWAALVAIGLTMVFCGFAFAQEPRRVALVIGNSKYKLGSELKNPVADAADMQVLLQRLGFKLVVGQDLTYDEFDAKLREFREAMRRADVALLFYAGHAVQYNDQNYLLPTDVIELKSETDIQQRAISLSRVLQEMEVQAGAAIVLLDACRDSPIFQGATRGSLLGSQTRVRFGSGLARMQAGTNRLLNFSPADSPPRI